MRIAIVGKGTSAIISALVCIKHGYEVDIFFDPNKPPINVGESTTPNIGGLLNEVLDICIGELIDAGIHCVGTSKFYEIFQELKN